MPKRNNVEEVFLGYEDYKTVFLYNSFFVDGQVDASDFYFGAYNANTTYVPVNEVESLGFSKFDPVNNWIPEHPELLDTAKTVYIHPSCEMPRTFAIKKYKKVLNPWMADAVVYPDLSKIRKPDISKYVIFINDEAKLIAYSPVYSRDWSQSEHFNDLLDRTNTGTPIGAMTYDTSYHIREVVNRLPSYYKLDYDINDLLAAKLVKCDNYYLIQNKDQWLMDILMSNVPKSKIVYENTFMNTLNDVDNKVTPDIIISIIEMLDSPDEEIVTAGLKALSTLDYSHYPNSVKFALSYVSSYKWRFNKARTSTACKYMLKQLDCWKYRNVYFRDTTIAHEDYNVLKEILERLNMMYFLEGCAFSYRDGNYNLQVRFKS